MVQVHSCVACRSSNVIAAISHCDHAGVMPALQLAYTAVPLQSAADHCCALDLTADIVIIVHSAVSARVICTCGIALHRQTQ